MSKDVGSFWKSAPGWAAIGLIGAAVYFLLMEHRAHVLGFLPYAVLLLCPLMHVFMHRSHGGHSSGEKSKTTETSGQNTQSTHRH